MTDRPVRSVRLAARRPVRVVVSLALAAAGAALVIRQSGVRQVETWAAAWVAAHVLGLTVVRSSVRPVLYVTLPGSGAVPNWIGLGVTPECTVALLLAPLLGLAAVLVLGRRLAIWAVLVATALTGSLLVVVNVARIMVIADALHLGGASTFGATHGVYGSLISIAGVCAGVVMFLKLLTRLSGRPTAVDQAT